MKKWLALCMAICLVVMLVSAANENVHAAGNVEQGQSQHDLDVSGQEDEPEVNTSENVQPWKDLTEHWAEPAVKHMSALALMNGYKDGNFRPELHISRAEFVAVLDRIFGFTGSHVTTFEDMQASAWYYDAMMRANGSGILLGTSDTTLSPAAPVTREDAAVMIDRAFQLSTEMKDDAVLEKYDDYSAVSEYSKQALSYMVSESIMKGYNGKLQPKLPITRAETAQLLSAMIGDVISSPDTYSPSTVEGNVIIRTGDVLVENTIVNGNLLLAEGIGEGDITLEGVKVTGSVIIKGGGSHSVNINHSDINRIVIDKNDKPVRVAFNNNSRIQQLLLLQQAIIELSKDSSIDTLLVDAEAHHAVIQAEGSIEELLVQASHVMVNDEEVRAGLRTTIKGKAEDNDNNQVGTGSPYQPSNPTGEKPVPATTIPDHQWQLVWNDEFNGPAIDASKWSVMDTGLVYNNELQYYSPNNTRIIKDNDRSVLQIEAKRGGDGGKDYSSGKLITMGKGDWTYGKVVVRAKLPVQQGIWPAIWMMPTDEAHYGGWPASGEIDIMELIGGEQNKNRVYSTLHFDSKQPDGTHGHVQGSLTLPEGQSFSDDYHDFQVEWLPGLIRFYVDGVMHHEVKDWQTKAAGQPEYYTFPAPFDRPFYLILNVAVGGDWPGSPNDDFESDTMEVDFVRVYSYNDLDRWPDVTGNPPKPEKLREPQADGNLIYNANFSEAVNSDGVPHQWEFLTNANGAGSVEVVDDELKGKVAQVTIDDAGTESYSIQLTQKPVYVEKHKRYKAQFDAKASAERSLMSKVTQFENSWTNYSGDRSFELTTAWQSYEYEFNMNASSDNNARFEFNLGLNDGTVMLANVRVIELGDADPLPEVPGDRPALFDGNLIYNGTFDQGKERLAFWKSSIASEAAAKVSVNNFLQFPIMERQLTVDVTETNGDPRAVVVAQPDLSLKANTTYGLYYDAKADSPRALTIDAVSTGNHTIQIAQGRTVQLGTDMQTYAGEIVVGDGDSDIRAALEFLFGESTGKVYIDNVRLVKRGNPIFVDGYAHVPATQAWLMQGLQLEDSSEGGKNIGYMDEGDLLQYKVQVARNANYVLSARLASEESNSTVGFTIKDETGSIVTQSAFNLGSTGGWQTYKTIPLAPVNLEAGRNYYVEFTGFDYNTLWIDFSENKVRDGQFSSELSEWHLIPTDLTASISEAGDLTIGLSGTTANWWDALLQQDQIALEANKYYRLEFDAYTSEELKALQVVLSQNGGEFNKYFEEEVQLSSSKQSYAFTIAMGAQFDENAVLAFGLGNSVSSNGAHTVSINEVRLYEINPNADQGGQPINVNLIANGDFSNGSEGWITYAAGDQSQLTIDTIDGKLLASIGDAGENSWDRQVIYEGLAIQQGSRYTISFKAKAVDARKLGIGIGWVDAENNYAWHGYFEHQVDLTAEEQLYTFTFEANKESYANARVSFDMGNMLGQRDSDTTITISDVSLVNIGPAN